MATIGSLFVGLKLGTEGFSSGLAGALRSLTGFVGGALAAINPLHAMLGGAGLVFSGAGFVDFIKHSMDSIAATAKMAKSLGVDVEAMSALSYAAGRTGLDMDELGKSMFHFLRALGEAREGSPEAIKKFTSLGFGAETLSGLPHHVDRAFGALGDALNKVPGQADRAFGVLGLDLKALATLPADQALLKVGDALNKMPGQADRAFGVLGLDLNALGKLPADQALLKVADALDKVPAVARQADRALGAVGVQVQDLAKMPADQALLKVADALNKLPTPADRANAVFKIFGKGAAGAFGFLSKGEGGLQALMKAAKDLGQTFTWLDAEKVIGAQKSFEHLGLAAKSVGIDMAVGLAPFLKWVGDKLSGVEKNAIAAKDAMKGLSETKGFWSNAGDFLADATQATVRTASSLAPAIEMGLDAMGEAASSGFGLFENRASKWFADDFEKLRNKLKNLWGGPLAHEEIAAAAEELKKLKKETDDFERQTKLNAAIQHLGLGLEASIATFGKGASALELYNLKKMNATDAMLAGVKVLADQFELMKQLGALRDVGGSAMDGMTDSMLKLRKAFDAGKLTEEEFGDVLAKLEGDLSKSLESKAAAVFDETRTPFEKMEAKLKDLAEMFQRGLWDVEGVDTYERAVMQVVDELEKAATVHLPEALLQGSAGAFSAVAKFEAGGAAKNDASNRVAKAVEEQIQIQRDTLRYTRETAQALAAEAALGELEI